MCISIRLQSFGCGKLNTTTSLRFIFLNPGKRYISVCSILSDLFRLNNRAPMTGFHTSTKSPSRSVGDMESLGIRKEEKRNTCARSQKTNRQAQPNSRFNITSINRFILQKGSLSSRGPVIRSRFRH